MGWGWEVWEYVLQTSGWVEEAGKRALSPTLHTERRKRRNILEFCEPSRLLIMKEGICLQRCPLPNVRSLVLETRGAPPLCPLHPPSWHCWPCLRCPTEQLLSWPPPPGLSLALTFPGSLPDHPDDVRCPPHAGSPEHPLLTLLTAHTQPFTTACSPVPPSPEYQLLEDGHSLREFLPFLQYPVQCLALKILFECINE